MKYHPAPIMDHHFRSPQIMHAGRGVEKREPSHTAGGNVSCCSHYANSTEVSQKKKILIELPYNPAIPLLGIYLEKTIIRRYMHPKVHCSSSYSSQDMGATMMSNDR